MRLFKKSNSESISVQGKFSVSRPWKDQHQGKIALPLIQTKPNTRKFSDISIQASNQSSLVNVIQLDQSQQFIFLLARDFFDIYTQYQDFKLKYQSQSQMKKEYIKTMKNLQSRFRKYSRLQRFHKLITKNNEKIIKFKKKITSVKNKFEEREKNYLMSETYSMTSIEHNLSKFIEEYITTKKILEMDRSTFKKLQNAIFQKSNRKFSRGEILALPKKLKKLIEKFEKI